jgi:hypothetical protein
VDTSWNLVAITAQDELVEPFAVESPPDSGALAVKPELALNKQIAVEAE